MINRFGSMISVHFTEQPVTDFEFLASISVFNKFFHGMLEQGIYLPPSAFESWFLNNALSTRDLDETIEAAAPASLIQLIRIFLHSWVQQVYYRAAFSDLLIYYRA